MGENLWADYSFVVRGRQRKQIISLMTRPKTPTELAKESKLNLTNASRVLVQFEKRGLARCLTPKEAIGRVYVLTARGKQVLKKMI